MRKNTMTGTLAAAAALSLALVAGNATAQMSDEDVAAQIQQEIAASPELSDVRIDVVAEDGMIKLMGLVEDMEHLTEIENILEGMEGVDNIENNIVVQ